MTNPKLPVNQGEPAKDRELLEQLRETHWKPAHHSMVEAAAIKYPALRGAIRLIQKWAGAQWISLNDCLEFWELLLCHLFETAIPNCSQAQFQTPNAAFWSLIHFLAYRTSAQQPIFVGMEEGGDSRQLLLRAWDLGKMVKSLRGEKPLWIATSNDPYSLFVPMPSLTEFKRLVCLARAVMSFPNVKGVAREIFTLGLGQFDCLILLRSPRELIDQLESGLKKKKAVIRKNLPASSPLRDSGGLFEEDPDSLIYPEKGLFLQSAFEATFTELQSALVGVCSFSRNPWLYPYAMMLGVNLLTQSVTPSVLSDRFQSILGDFFLTVAFKGEAAGIWRRAKDQLSFF
eukprot:Protomagalhaensia_sp_Gyna_25__1871@NODE_1992_length_1362_cov_6_033258_g1642_i0_p1_GENE_NODE_1992_length_1362_cov_6_033258_g1642_i0NODE_1992_length_1362_cov_6_033258_g1642_i0_p1_ORF_typecomplete_len344_score73_70Nrap_D5/PF17406_2/2_2e14LssY_C/PF14067_6/1_3e03LssY_C/PF14067_6/0_29_NODE_1992_length_1362_cov_6_033258_g1642_i02931324